MAPSGMGQEEAGGVQQSPPLPCPFPQPPADALRQDAVTPAGAGSPAWAGGFGNRQPPDAAVPGSTAAPLPRPDPGHPDPHPAQGHPPRHGPAQPQDPRSPRGPCRALETPSWGPLTGRRLRGHWGPWDSLLKRYSLSCFYMIFFHPFCPFFSPFPVLCQPWHSLPALVVTKGSVHSNEID